jgi:hypothetical protein
MSQAKQTSKRKRRSKALPVWGLPACHCRWQHRVCGPWRTGSKLIPLQATEMAIKSSSVRKKSRTSAWLRFYVFDKEGDGCIFDGAACRPRLRWLPRLRRPRPRLWRLPRLWWAAITDAVATAAEAAITDAVGAAASVLGWAAVAGGVAAVAAVAEAIGAGVAATESGAVDGDKGQGPVTLTCTL